jgi:hypothetical protein
MSDSPLTVTMDVDTSAATTALEFALAQLPPIPDEDEPEECPVGGEETNR